MSNTSGLSAGRPSRAKTEPPATLSAVIGTTEDLVRINFETPVSKRRWLKGYVAREETTITDLFNDYIDSLMSRDR